MRSERVLFFAKKINLFRSKFCDYCYNSQNSEPFLMERKYEKTFDFSSFHGFIGGDRVCRHSFARPAEKDADAEKYDEISRINDDDSARPDS